MAPTRLLHCLQHTHGEHYDLMRMQHCCVSLQTGYFKMQFCCKNCLCNSTENGEKKLVSIIDQVISCQQDWKLKFSLDQSVPIHRFHLSPAGKRGLYWLVGASSLFWWCDYEQVCAISSCLQQHWCNHSRSEFHALESVSWQRFMLRAKIHFVMISYNMDQMLQINFKENPLM